jgi:hypothetical protein
MIVWRGSWISTTFPQEFEVRVDSQIKTPEEENWGEAKGVVDSLIKDTGNEGE